MLGGFRKEARSDCLASTKAIASVGFDEQNSHDCCIGRTGHLRYPLAPGDCKSLDGSIGFKITILLQYVWDKVGDRGKLLLQHAVSAKGCVAVKDVYGVGFDINANSNPMLSVHVEREI